MADDVLAEKRMRSFAFAKRSPYRQFAFAKRSTGEDELEDEAEVQKRGAESNQLAFKQLISASDRLMCKSPYRQFAFAKRASPYGFAFAKRGVSSFA
ncbi:unnamed protein product [Heligmosomoides polygyrus]|uniref:Uncharacterized protein n=1 Tax=Heligmosomoides polygyrus TaxID=6339 RepID=A0A183G3H3_HELPZ|nr:unnamed protein product [Heligmosomoides polygyrus]